MHHVHEQARKIAQETILVYSRLPARMLSRLSSSSLIDDMSQRPVPVPVEQLNYLPAQADAWVLIVKATSAAACAYGVTIVAHKFLQLLFVALDGQVRYRFQTGGLELGLF